MQQKVLLLEHEHGLQLATKVSDLSFSREIIRVGLVLRTPTIIFFVFHGAGEIYLAFFNLDSASRKITARVSDLEKVVRRKMVRKHLCSCTEVWSGKSSSLVKRISAVVNSHGSMVFEIKC